jgi:hypothetical protein
MVLQKTGETGKIIRVEVFRVSQKCGGEGGIFGRRGFGSNRHEGFFENPSTENILRRRIRGEMERGLWRLDHWSGLTDGARSPITATHRLNPATFMMSAKRFLIKEVPSAGCRRNFANGKYPECFLNELSRRELVNGNSTEGDLRPVRE